MPGPLPLDPPAPARPERRRMLRLALWIVVPLVLLCAVGYWNAQRVAEATLERHRAKFEQERRDISGKVRSRPALLEPVAQGTSEEVVERFVRAVELVPEEERSRLQVLVPDEQGAASPEDQDRILAAHPEPLRILATILHVPSTTPAAPLDRVDKATSVLVAPRQVGGQWVVAHLRRSVARTGRPEQARALRGVAELVTLAADFERRGTMIALLAGSHLQGIALLQLPAAFAMGPVGGEEARTLARVLDDLEAVRSPLSEVAAFERANLRGLFSVKTMDIDQGLRNVGWRHLWSGKVFRAEAMDELDVGMDRLLEIWKTAPTDPRRAIEDLRRWPDGVSNPLVRLGLSPWGITLRRTIQRDAVWRVGRTALAVAQYAAEQGAAPASLASLVPTYLPVAPTDPWDGQPLRYEAGPSARIWSIGRDGKDDGGAPTSDPDDESQPGDFVITVQLAR